jgi:pyrroline-5-carboxylate reductase
MASAMVSGLLARKAAAPPEIACIGGDDDTARELARRTGITAHAELASLLATADTVVLACKPQQLAGLDPHLADLTAGRLVISILAGKRLARLAQTFPRTRNLVRAMPNTPGQIGAGITGWCALRPLDAADRRLVDTVLGALGQAIELEEKQLDAVTALSGSGPAYLFEFVAAMREGGVAAGLPRDVAAQLAQATALGSARLLAETQAEPEALRDQVTSPHGTTFAGLQRMAARGFRDTIRETILAAKARSEELSKED